MPNDLIPADLNPTDIAVHSEEDFIAMTSSDKFLPRLMLGASGSKQVQMNLVQAGSYYVVEGSDKTIPLSDEVDCLVLDWQPKAMDTSGDDVISVNDVDSPEMKRIQLESEVKDSGCMFGPEFLLYLPELNLFVTYFMSSKTARREAKHLSAQMKGAATLKSHFIDPKKSRHSWWGPVITPCSTITEVPELERMQEASIKFRMKPEVETVAPDERQV